MFLGLDTWSPMGKIVSQELGGMAFIGGLSLGAALNVSKAHAILCVSLPNDDDSGCHKT